MLFDNISNDLSTNMFEAATGALNAAPVKLSGQYKIVIASDLTLWLDDYNNRRVAINKDADFLPQVASFLRTPTVLKDNSKLFYGGYSYPTNMTWHCPIYMGSDGSLPTHFVITRAQNAQITDPATLQNFSSIISLIDLEQTGVNGLLRQMLTTSVSDYPLQLNWNAAEMLLYGYSINTNAILQQTINLLDSQANQPYYAVLNNLMLNSFAANGLIYPRLVNVEAEFDYVDNSTHFNNFYGYLSIANPIPLADYVNTVVTARVQEQQSTISWVQQLAISQQLQQYEVPVGSSTLIKLDTQPAQLRVLAARIQAGDNFTIMHPDGSIYFKYVIVPQDIQATLLETLKQLCIKLSSASGRFLNFSCSTAYVITIVADIEDDLIEEYVMLPSPSFIFIDNNQSNFRQITENDIKLGNSANVAVIQTYGQLVIDGVTYFLADTFDFGGATIIRLTVAPVFNGYTLAQILDNRTEDLLQLPPIPWLSMNSNLKAYPQYDVPAYAAELTEKFVTGADPSTPTEILTAIEVAIAEFSAANTAVDVPPYVGMDASGNFDTIDEIAYDETLNDNGVLFMGFNTPGTTSFITPNMFNMDMQFWDKNGNPDAKLLKVDQLKYHWFLIKSEAPTYTGNDIRQFRYFTDRPKIGARLIANGTLWSGEAYCETVFLGVRYQLPQRYSGYLFSVYLDPNDTSTASSVSYNFEVDDAAKTLYLRINKYLDFSDLIRGANSENPAFLDLGLIYSATASYNTESTVVSGFNSGGVLLADNTLTTLFGSIPTTDFKIQDTDSSWYICLKRSLDVVTAPFDEIFLPAGNANFSVFQTVTYQGQQYEYVSMEFTIVGIHQVAADYIWCRDLLVNFFDTPTIFANAYDGVDPNEVFQIDLENDVISMEPVSGAIYGDQNVIVTVMVDGQNKQYRLLAYDKTYSFVDNWFELTRNIAYPTDTAQPKVITDGFFTFPSFFKTGWGLAELQAQFIEGSFDNITKVQRITLFDRNQIWHMIRDTMVVEAKFKASTTAQIINRLADLLVSQLEDTANLGSIPATGGTDQYINMAIVDADVNLVIWQTGAVGKETPKLHVLNRFRGQHLPYLKKLPDELAFQADLTNRFQTSIYSIWDPNFGGQGVSATGLWAEVTGNVVSSLFSMAQTITVTQLFGTQFDTRALLAKFITIDEAIIVNNNAAYISKIDANVNQYIQSAYINWLLLNEYSLTLVQNELGQKVSFTQDPKNAYLVNFQPANTYQTRFNSLIFNFNRK
jgi:hypothetical protein